ncbi:hypothetical protein F5X68DRAFT_250025 [Plectosphaerella plurivora]|uniref:Gag protein n=1 Tax=Plectosphaerella plurivora TaxID=936078 RepID=A0A9P9A3V1_9PEZI|nr:hypothetical protein F5X68DRAFT_250025 [Plectosphaerella plurivora]
MAATTTAYDASKIRLAGPFDWTAWSREFKRLSIDAAIWDKIDPDEDDPEPFVKRPREPLVEDYLEETPGVGTRSSTSQSRLMSTEQNRQYTIDWNRYTERMRQYQSETASIKILKNWVVSTIAGYLYEDSCEPEQSLRTWYTLLKKHCSTTNISVHQHLRQQYLETVKPLTRPPQSFENWINNWQQTLSRASKQGMLES